MLVLVGYGTVHPRLHITKVHPMFHGTPRDGPVFRPIHHAASSRSPVKRWSDMLGGNRELTSSVNFLPKAAPPLVKLHA